MDGLAILMLFITVIIGWQPDHNAFYLRNDCMKLKAFEKANSMKLVMQVRARILRTACEVSYP